jgi:hypothetical protein
MKDDDWWKEIEALLAQQEFHETFDRTIELLENINILVPMNYNPVKLTLALTVENLKLCKRMAYRCTIAFRNLSGLR